MWTAAPETAAECDRLIERNQAAISNLAKTLTKYDKLKARLETADGDLRAVIKRRDADLAKTAKSRDWYMSANLDARKERDRLKAINDELLAALKNLNHMGGDERGGYCICPCGDGSAPDEKHATSCANARNAIAKAQPK